MQAKAELVGRSRDPHLQEFLERNGGPASAASDADEVACAAFAYLRGISEKALAVEFCLKTGDREGFSYSLLNSWRFNPSVGLLMKFTGDNMTYVLITGSNLDATVNDSVDLIERGIQKHRIVAVYEMDEDAIAKAGKGPTVDRILIGECESAEEQLAWLKKHAPDFLRK
jgi:hypothetical protein